MAGLPTPNTAWLTPLLLLLFTAGVAVAQQRVSMGFYNVENLFDTISSPEYDDSQFTPGGKNSWGTERYERKIGNIARAIDAMALDVVGLAEVEGEQVVRDIVRALKTDYNYIWRSSGDRRGMDIALLYKGDKFIPGRVSQVGSVSHRRPLYVQGEMLGQRVDIIVCHMPSMFNRNNYRTAAMRSLYSFVERLHSEDSRAQIVLMGDFNATPTDRMMRKVFGMGVGVMDGPGFLFNPLAKDARQGFGSYVYDGRWLLYDNALLDIGFISGAEMRYKSGGIFVRDYMLDSDGTSRRGSPLRTFYSGRYLGGYSDHLPIYLIFEVPDHPTRR